MARALLKLIASSNIVVDLAMPDLSVVPLLPQLGGKLPGESADLSSL